MADESKMEPRLLLSDSLLLALLTGSAYWIALQYETAYLKVYGFPDHATHVSLESTLIVLIILSGIIWLLFPLANLIAFFWPENPALKSKFARVTLFIGFPVWTIINYGFRLEDLFYYIFMISFAIIFEIIWPLLVYKNKKSLRERLIADEIAEEETRSLMLFGRIFQALGPVGYGYVLLLIIGSLLAHEAGDAKAKTQTQYLVYISDPTLAVVRLYHDRTLCIRIDQKNKCFDGIVIKPSVEEKAEFKKLKVGPLKEKTTGTP